MSEVEIKILWACLLTGICVGIAASFYVASRDKYADWLTYLGAPVSGCVVGGLGGAFIGTLICVFLEGFRVLTS